MTRRNEWLLALSLALLAILSSWNGIHNGFAYDDVFIVESNKLLRDLGNWWMHFGRSYWPVQWGADGYRPLTIIAFSLEWAIGGGKPWVFHATNIALYAFSAVAVYRLGRTFLPTAAAWVAAALFAVHPLHVEAVGNIVGQSELLVAAFLLPAATLYITGRNEGTLSLRRKVAIGVLYALACLSKEHGIVLPGVLLAAELIIVRDPRPVRQRFVELRPFVLCLVVVALLFLLAHGTVSSEVLTGFHQYVPFSSMGVDTVGRVWTMFGLVPEWVRLFLWPARLSAEYGPPEFPVVTQFEPYQVPGMIILGALLAMIVVARKRAPAVSFGLAMLAVTLLPTSNFVVATGILLAERTLFLPSAGAMFAVAAVVPWLMATERRRPLRLAATAALPILLILGIRRSLERTKVWMNNETLFTQSVEDAPFVYRSHFMLGAWKFNQKRKVEGEKAFRVAITMYDKDPYVFYALGSEYLNAGMYRSAVENFTRVIALDTSIIEARARLALAYSQLHMWREAREHALVALRHNTRSVPAMRSVLKYAIESERREAASREPTSLVEVMTEAQKNSGKSPPTMQKAVPPAPGAPKPKL